ncbi:MAG: zinc-ribbon domain-containing protein [Ruminococcus sp.]
MLCKKCRKEIPDGSIYCNYCGKKQETTKRKVRRRPRGAGCIRHRTDCRDNPPYVPSAPRTTAGSR